MFVYVWLRSEICQCAMNAEWSNKCGECWFPEFYANQSSLTHSSRCNSLLNVTLHTHSFCHTHSHTRSLTHTQNKTAVTCMRHHHTYRWDTEEASESDLLYTGKGEILERTMCDAWCVLACDEVGKCVCISEKVPWGCVCTVHILNNFHSIIHRVSVWMSVDPHH